MNNGLIHYVSLALFGLAIALTNAVELYKEVDIFSTLMFTGGITISLTALKPILNGDYKNFESKGRWSYLIALGALLMILGAAIRITNIT